MYILLDDAVVGLVLAASIGYAVYSLGPRAWRPRWLAAAAGLLGHLPKCVGLHSVALRWQTGAVSKPSGACGGCDSCGSEAVSTGRPAERSEVSVPLSKIGKRSS